MKNSKTPPLIRWWLSPKFPEAQINKLLSYQPNGLNNLINDRVRTWGIHPIKRRIAKYYLVILRHLFDIKVIAITGSCGKTSTKEMIASILSRDGETVASFKNIDPIYNIPTTILRCKPSTKYLVLEMGVEYPEEMDFYLWLAQPDISVITNIYPTHTEFFSNINGVLKEKEKLAKGVSRNGTVILNKENNYLRKLDKNLHAKLIYFGKSSKITASNMVIDSNMSNIFTLAIDMSKIDVQLPVVGDQFISNSLAAASVGHVLCIPLKKIKEGLEKFKSPEHRMNFIKMQNGALIIDDSYNNNPEAAKAAIKTLKMLSKGNKRIVVFGDMLELGKKEIPYHKELGRLISQSGVSFLIGVGEASKYLVEEATKKMSKESTFWTKDKKLALNVLIPHLKKNSVTLIKGSRSIGLDKMVAALSK